MYITLGLRVTQIIFSIVVLGLSVGLIKGQQEGKAPSQTDFAAFCGGCGLVFAAIGTVAVFVDSLQGVIMLALDGIATLFTVAGGSALAVALKIINCTNVLETGNNDIIRGRTDFGSDGNKIAFGKFQGDSVVIDTAALENRCHEAQATDAFLFFMLAVFASTLVLGLMGKGGRNGSIV